MEWQPITTGPFDRDLELAVITYDGTHALSRANPSSTTPFLMRQGAAFSALGEMEEFAAHPRSQPSG
jgi:hypothetical protein